MPPRLAPRRILVASVAALLACGPPPPAPVVHAEPTPTPDATDPASPAPTEPPPVEARPCAEVDIGLDLRALPTHAGLDGIDMFVRGEADDLRTATRGPPAPEVFVQPGVGSLHARFVAADVATALARCERAVTAYLEHAPRLPLRMDPAAQVVQACRRCR